MHATHACLTSIYSVIYTRTYDACMHAYKNVLHAFVVRRHMYIANTFGTSQAACGTSPRPRPRARHWQQPPLQRSPAGPRARRIPSHPDNALARTHFGALTGNGGLGDGRGRGRARGLRLAPDHMERGPDAVSRPGALSIPNKLAVLDLRYNKITRFPRHCHNNKRKHTCTRPPQFF